MELTSGVAKAALKELNKRKKLQENKTALDLKKFMFPKQHDFFCGSGFRFRVACCSRRAGKTVGIAAKMIEICNTVSDAKCLYITTTKEAARKIIWFDLLDIINKYSIPCKVNNHTLEISFNNNSRIFIEGAKDKGEIEKFRGWKLNAAFIDEMQSMRYHVKELIEDVIMKCLSDLGGHLYLTGTPGPVKAGPFYEYFTNDVWYSRHWTAFDNPHLHSPEEGKDYNRVLQDEILAKRIDVGNPAWRRETYGEWVGSEYELVLHYKKDVNDYKSLSAGRYNYIIGFDVGHDDADAIAVLAYSFDTGEVYLVEETVTRKQDITALVTQLKPLIKTYDPIKIIMDAGALGKKIQEEICNRHHIPVEAADKKRKLEHLAFLDADMKRGIFRAKADSVFAEDCSKVTFSVDKKNVGKLEISDNYHSDIIDAVLYAYRECKHYIDRLPSKPMQLTEAEKVAKQEQEEEETADLFNSTDNDFLVERIMDSYRWEDRYDD